MSKMRHEARNRRYRMAKDHARFAIRMPKSVDAIQKALALKEEKQRAAVARLKAIHERMKKEGRA